MIIPVHQGNHWTALMVDVAARRLVFFDSMLGENRRAMAEVKKWVADEAKVGWWVAGRIFWGGGRRWGVEFASAVRVCISRQAKW